MKLRLKYIQGIVVLLFSFCLLIIISHYINIFSSHIIIKLFSHSHIEIIVKILATYFCTALKVPRLKPYPSWLASGATWHLLAWLHVAWLEPAAAASRCTSRFHPTRFSLCRYLLGSGSRSSLGLFIVSRSARNSISETNNAHGKQMNVAQQMRQLRFV